MQIEMQRQVVEQFAFRAPSRGDEELRRGRRSRARRRPRPRARRRGAERDAAINTGSAATTPSHSARGLPVFRRRQPVSSRVAQRVADVEQAAQAEHAEREHASRAGNQEHERDLGTAASLDSYARHAPQQPATECFEAITNASSCGRNDQPARVQRQQQQRRNRSRPMRRAAGPDAVRASILRSKATRRLRRSASRCAVSASNSGAAPRQVLHQLQGGEFGNAQPLRARAQQIRIERQRRSPRSRPRREAAANSASARATSLASRSGAPPAHGDAARATR